MGDKSENSINKLFEYIRGHEWDKFNNLIDNDEIDINVTDTGINYLLTYAVKYNRIDIVIKLLEKGAKYDITDNMGRSILFDAIESNYYNIIEKMVEHANDNIGIAITDIRDIKGNIPLHYGILTKNFNVVKLLLDAKSNPHTVDIEGYNAMHLAARVGSIEIFTEITKYMTQINSKTKRGETSLHISINYQYLQISRFLLDNSADPNIVDNENEFTPLHYAVGWDNYDIVELLLQKGADMSIQDIYGNVPLIYCVKEEHNASFNVMMKYAENNKNSFNLWNIYGKIVLHEVLETYDDTKQYYLDSLIEHSNLLIQDSYGNSCFYYLVLYDIWEKYIEILKKKKLNIFAKNSDNQSVLDMLYSDDMNNDKYNKLIDTVVESYLYILKKEKKEWKEELDKICSRELEELTDSDKKYITDNIKDNNDVVHGCKLLIRNKLIGNIKKYKEGKLQFCQKSYPSNLTQCIELSEGIMVDVCTFTGSLLDVLIGLMLLLKKHKNACTTIGKNRTQNSKVCDFYKSMGLIMNGRCEFLNFEIIWIDYKMYMIDDFSVLFNDCIKSSARFIIIPLGIEMKTGSHANYLIYDKSIKEIERFEPHGGTTPIGFNYNAYSLDETLSDYFSSIDTEIKYIKPQEYIPKIGFQILDSQEDKKSRIGDPSGFCALWSMWYVDNRLTYHMYTREELIKNLFRGIKSQNISYRNMIRNYSRNIINERDKFLREIDIDINDWLNDNYTNTQLDKFMSILMAEINVCCTAKSVRISNIKNQIPE